jgi:hypothetical protein
VDFAADPFFLPSVEVLLLCRERGFLETYSSYRAVGTGVLKKRLRISGLWGTVQPEIQVANKMLESIKIGHGACPWPAWVSA